MKCKYIGIIAFLLVIVVLIASCNLGSPDLVLRVVNPTYQIIGNDVHITFELKNTGSEQQFSAKTKNDVRIWDGTGLKFFALHF